MNREDIIRMGRQAGSLIEIAQEKDLLWLERFAQLVAAEEREACAEVCDYYAGPFNAHRIGECADKIRARGKQ